MFSRRTPSPATTSTTTAPNFSTTVNPTAAERGAARVPGHVVEVAHIALHSCWATPSTPDPAGTGCSECLPDLASLVTPLWRHVQTGRPVPAWAVAQAALTLHNTWSSAPIGPSERAICQDCVEDIQVIVHGIENAKNTPRRHSVLRLRRKARA